MSKRKPSCLHCLITEQVKFFHKRGYSREYIVEHILAALADYIANTSEFEERIDVIADVMRKMLAGMLHERVLAVQEPAGRA